MIDHVDDAVCRQHSDVRRDDDLQRLAATHDETVRDDYRKENGNEEVPGGQDWHREDFSKEEGSCESEV